MIKMATLRKSAASMTMAEQNRYISVIKQLIHDPTNPYGKLVAVHSDMSHDMHGMDVTGTQRFLPWHRVYLLRLEEMMQAIDPQCFVPYWDWTTLRKVPTWLSVFKPKVFVPGQRTIMVTRKPRGAAALPTKTDVDGILTSADYTSFTDRLEMGPHNAVHLWVNGTMSRIPTAPADPLFWLHHAQMDRLWNIWQMSNPGQNPSLIGPKAQMDPWAETESQVRSVSALGYSYQQ